MKTFDWTNAVVLVTGGTGTFGHAVIPALLARQVSRVVVYSRDETKQSELLAKFAGLPVEGFIGDVRDAERLRWAMGCRPDAVIHAAALKQVPSCQYNWPEAIATNVGGSENVAKACIEAGVQVALALSTDKACEPVNVYGKTKALMEEIFIWANAWVGLGPTRLGAVRYGNVLGSRGSVMEVFKAQAQRGGLLQVTDPRMTRFVMSPGEAVEFVLGCAVTMQGGEIFVPRLRMASLLDFAEAAAPGMPFEIVGRRSGEKDHEVLVSLNELSRTRDLGDRYVIYPDGPTWPLERRGQQADEPHSSRMAEWAGIEALR